MKYSDSTLVSNIKKGGQELHPIMDYIYEKSGFRSDFHSVLKKLGANDQDIEDLFQDAILSMIVNVQSGNYEGKSTLKTYLISIGKYSWLNQRKHQKVHEHYQSTLKSADAHEDLPDRYVLYNESAELLDETLSGLGEMCKTILSMWSLNFSMKEIAAALKHESEGFIRKKKHTCMKSLVTLLKNQPDLIDQLL